jgi:hypothetical protein
LLEHIYSFSHNMTEAISNQSANSNTEVNKKGWFKDLKLSYKYLITLLAYLTGYIIMYIIHDNTVQQSDSLANDALDLKNWVIIYILLFNITLGILFKIKIWLTVFISPFVILFQLILVRLILYDLLSINIYTSLNDSPDNITNENSIHFLTWTILLGYYSQESEKFKLKNKSRKCKPEYVLNDLQLP